MDFNKFKKLGNLTQPKTTRHNHGGSSFIPPALGRLKDYIEASKDADLNPAGS